MRVLVIEDEEDLLRGLARSLLGEGYAVDTAGDGERELLLQVATNLVSNAIYYNLPGGWVRASTAVLEEFTELTVSNSGPGIATAELVLVVERFYRAEKSRANGHHHSGLGLAIVEAIVKAHGGAVTVESKLNAETTFTVRLSRAGQTD